MADRDAKWNQLERGNRELAELRNRTTPSHFSTFSEFNSREDKSTRELNFFNSRKRTLGEETIGSLIRNLARELKLSPQEVSTWSLSDVIYMYTDLISKMDVEMYSMYESNQKIEQNCNTRRL